MSLQGFEPRIQHGRSVNPFIVLGRAISADYDLGEQLFQDDNPDVTLQTVPAAERQSAGEALGVQSARAGSGVVLRASKAQGDDPEPA